jgi:hypothetical protein
MKSLPALVVGAFALAMPSNAAAQRAFNGNWSVEVVTQQGSCDRAYRFPVVIENGRIRYGGSERINISGVVNARGIIRSSIAANGLRADVAGRLSAGFGSGTWVLAGSRNCAGTWNAERRRSPAA